jgi:hypothetical protein
MGFGFLVWKSAGFLGHKEQGICEMGFQCLRERERAQGFIGFFFFFFWPNAQKQRETK